MPSLLIFIIGGGRDKSAPTFHPQVTEGDHKVGMAPARGAITIDERWAQAEYSSGTPSAPLARRQCEQGEQKGYHARYHCIPDLFPGKSIFDALQINLCIISYEIRNSFHSNLSQNDKYLGKNLQ
jgi:hypothetical protein